MSARWSLCIILPFAVLLTAGCTDEPLADMGHLTQRWISAAPEPTAVAPAVTAPAPIGLQATDGEQRVEWVNDQLGEAPSLVPEEVVSAVWERSNKEDRFVQASRSEIAAALPGLTFPELIPQKVAFVTSQLVFDPSKGELSTDTLAAFGFWSVKPYSKSRSVAQLAVLRVAAVEEPVEPVVPDTIGVPDQEPGDTRCEHLAGATVDGCRAMYLEDGCPAWSVEMSDGWRLVWSELGYEYDLFVRNASSIDLLARMAGSCAELVPVITADAEPEAGDAIEGTQTEAATDDPGDGSDS